MGRLRIVVDGAADMPPEWKSMYDIDVLPLRVAFGDEIYTQGPSFTPNDFYQMVQKKKMMPKSSLPSIGQIKEFYRSIAQKGDTILSIHISGKLSGTLATVESAARELASELKIIVFDSEAGSAAQAFMAREARIMERSGAQLPDILARLEAIRKKITIIFTLNTLEFAHLSGRINSLQKAIVSMLQVKPIVVLHEGLLDMAEKVRTRQRSLERVIQLVCQRVGSRLVNIAVVHAADPQTAQDLLNKTRSILNIKEAVLAELSIPVAANLVPGAIGIVAYPVEEDS